MGIHDTVEGLSRGLVKVFGSRNERMIRAMLPLVEEVNSHETRMSSLSDEGLRALTGEFRGRLADGAELDGLLPEAFAAVREAARRVIGQRHYDVQMVGGIVLHNGGIAEMVTGEGKTLVETCPAYLNALPLRKGGATGSVHIVTVNDYLAKRDAEWMGPILEFLGLKVGCIQSSMEPSERKPAYDADVTYGTNNEFGFDYLRKNMRVRVDDQAQSVLNYAIVDEVDSVLVDEARTPLIISGASEGATTKYYDAAKCARQLYRGADYEVKEKESAVILKDEAIEKAQRIIGVESFYEGSDLDWPHLIEQSLRAKELFKRDTDYVVKDGDVIIVDEFTGRLMPGRRWSDGLHQAIEAKENLKIVGENQTLATVTFQNFFRLYKKLAGMTGTALTEAAEFDKIYGLDVLAIPTNRPLVRESYPDVIYRTGKEKYKAIVEEIGEIHETGRPILVGTTSIANSELISKLLARTGVEHEVLNAKHHEREASIVENAGQPGNVTIATNMAGRGTDIQLGPGVADRGGLHIIGSERHEARRIDNQLRGRAGRQGDPGSNRFFLSLEDDLMRVFAGDKVGWILEKVGMTEGVPIESKIVSRAIENAQRKVEAHNFDIRKNLVEYDEVMDKQRSTIYDIRQQCVGGEDIRETVLDWVHASIGRAADLFIPKSGGDFEGLREWAHSKMAVDVKADDVEGLNAAGALEAVYEIAEKLYAEREERFTPEIMRRIEQFLVLDTIDSKWKDHLYHMDYLRSAVSFEGYAQKDPKITYKIEGFHAFEKTIESIQDRVTEMIFKVAPREDAAAERRERLKADSYSKEQYGQFDTAASAEMGRAADASGKGGAVKVPFRHKVEKVGRNDPCPCGSGKKYKKCCGSN